MIVGIGRVLVGAVALLATVYPSTARQLLSIEGINLAPRQFVSAFRIETWGVRVIAVCKVPRGWGISVSQSANLQGVLTGTAGHGVAFADADDVKRRFLHLFLTDDPMEVQGDRPGHPLPSFNGRIEIGVYGRDRTTWQPLTPQNYVLAPANLCPDPDG